MTIHFSSAKPHLKSIEVSVEDCKNKSLMTLLLEARLPVASSCQGDGICSRCRVHILAGRKNVSPEQSLETATKKKNKVAESERLSCQVHIQGDVEIDTLYW